MHVYLKVSMHKSVRGQSIYSDFSITLYRDFNNFHWVAKVSGFFHDIAYL